MFQVKIENKYETLYYTVYAIERTHIFSHMTTIFLIYDSEKGFHWVDSDLCQPA